VVPQAMRHGVAHIRPHKPKRGAVSVTAAKKTEVAVVEEEKQADQLKALVSYVTAAVVFGGGIWATMGADSGQVGGQQRNA